MFNYLILAISVLLAVADIPAPLKREWASAVPFMDYPTIQTCMRVLEQNVDLTRPPRELIEEARAALAKL